MWCYQKPDFEGLLMAELQRQQQCSQFCDTLLKAEGLSVPAHSCILSAISPQFSSSLSSMPVPPTGQSRLLEFRALGPCTLLHMVRLLYSGEMAGEGEKEKQEAVSAAAKLGIHGLVEITQKEQKCRNTKGDQYKEVGVQTETLMFKEAVTRQGRWRREVRDGSTLLWREASPSSERETWTQTEVQCAPTSQPSVSFDTIDMKDLQSLQQTDSHLVLPQIPFIPVSLVYTPDENQALIPSCSSASTVAQAPPAAGYRPVPTAVPPSAPPPNYPFPSQAAQCADGPQTWRSGSHVTVVGEGLEDEGFEQFEGNISGFINYFLNSEKEEKGSRGRRAGRRRGSRGRGMAETSTRRPRTRGTGRGRLMQTVDVQDVGVSRFAKMFQQRWGMQPNRTTGQGGGAVGRKLYVKTRQVLISGRSVPRRRQGKAQDFSGGGNIWPKCDTGGEANRRTVHKLNEDGPPVPRAQRGRAKSSSLPFGSTPVDFYTASSPSPSIHLPVCHTSLPPPAPPAPPPYVDQPEHFDRLLEEVMLGLNILPSNNEQSQNKQQNRVTQGAAVAEGASDSANCDVPILHQQAEGELSDILDHFLQSFEQHISSCATREEKESDGPSSKDSAGPSKYKKNKIRITSHRPPADPPSHRAAKPSQITERQQNEETGIPPKHSQTSADCTVAPKHPETLRKVNPPARPKRRQRNTYRFSLEKPKVKVKRPKLLSNGKKKHHHLMDKQLQQMPVVKLERNGPLPVNITLQGHSYEYSALTSSSAKHPRDDGLERNHKDNIAFLEEPLSDKKSPPTRQKYPCRGRPRKNGHLPCLSNGDVSRATAECDEGQQVEVTEDRCENHEDESTVQPQEEEDEPARMGRKKRKESDDDDDDDARLVKRICPEPPPVLQSPQHDCEAAEIEEIDVETVSLSSEGDLLRNKHEIRGGDAEENPEESHMDEDVESNSDEIIDVERVSLDNDDSRDVEMFCRLNSTPAGLSCFSLPPEETSPDSMDIDVIGWTDCSEGGDKTDVTDENIDCTSTLFLNKGDLVDRKYNIEALFH